LDSIRTRGFEVNIHDLNHDGRLFDDRDQFLSRVRKINQYGKDFGARGFRSAVLYRRSDWMSELEFEYDMSVPSVAHLDPQRGGCCTVMPYFIDRLLEIPVTVIQDYSLFHILCDYSIKIWQKQVSEISEAHGVANFIVHPDYIIDSQARRSYENLLSYLAALRRDEKLWVAKPDEISQWWRARSQMGLVQTDCGWRVEGSGSERARIAYARAEGNRVVYRFEQNVSGAGVDSKSMPKVTLPKCAE
jgi:hypothetical protein